MVKAAQHAASAARANAPAKMETKTEGRVDDNRHQANSDSAMGDEEEELETREAKPLAAASFKLQMDGGGHWRVPLKRRSAITCVNQRRLGRLLDRLAVAHRWREACGVLSTLFAGYPYYRSALEDRRNFMIAMELQKRFCRKKNYINLIKSTYDIWLCKLSRYKKGHEKKHVLQLELALFYLTQGKLTNALSHTRFLVTEKSGSEPFINLIHGLILYQLWYADLPEEMQIKGFDVHTSSDALRVPFIDGFHEIEIDESSHGHDAVDIENIMTSRCSSESSIGNEKIIMEGNYEATRNYTFDDFIVKDHTSQCNEEERASPRNQDNFVNTSIYFTSGLDKILLPIQLKLLTDDPIQSILLYRKLANEKYREAVKHLRLALHSTPPVLAALLPLIQLLLLGDQVHDAIVELDKSCHELDLALPFRLKARLLQCFCSSKISMISSCYESALTRDPSCNYSMERLIKMHKTGNYNTEPLLEMLAKHLDAVDGKCSIWEEFASCFRELQTSIHFHYEDCISANIGGVTDNVYCNRRRMMFAEGETSDTWRLRFRWWASRHFGKNIYFSEIQAGEWTLLQFKAACAIHLYGPNCEYATAALNSLTQRGNADQLSYIHSHMKNPMNLKDYLTNKPAAVSD